MSYSFNVKASSKDDAIVQVEEQLHRVETSQPAHAKDKTAALAAAASFINLLGDVPSGHVIHVSMSGSVGWKHDDPDFELTSAGVNVSARISSV